MTDCCGFGYMFVFPDEPKAAVSSVQVGSTGR